MTDAVPGLVGTFGLVLPELVLILVACGFYTAAAARSTDPGRGLPLRDRWGLATLMALSLTAITWAVTMQAEAPAIAGSPLVHDPLAWVVKGISLIGASVLVLLGWNQVEERQGGEYYGSLLLMVAGVNLVAMANDLVALFLALEMVSIPTYVVLFLTRRDRYGQEATIKYFLLSVFSSALALYGISFLYGVAGTTNLALIQAAFRFPEGQTTPDLLVLAIALFVAGLGFRITAVPFHFYAPDVFCGTGPSAAALLSFVPKVAGFAALVRFVSATVLQPAGPTNVAGSSAPYSEITLLLVLLAGVTMLAGNALALVQTDIRRLLAYSSVAHAGYMLVGIAVGQVDRLSASGAHAVIFYLAAYGAMTLGAFSVLVSLGRRDQPVRDVDELAGLFRAHPLLALCMAGFLFSLIGLPPTAGFWGKLQLFLAALSERKTLFVGLAVFMALNAAIGAFYYLRVVTIMFLEPPADEKQTAAPLTEMPGLLAVGVCAAITIGLFVAPNLLMSALAKVAF